MRLLYFSPVQWGSYAQRPHYMIRYFLGCHPENQVLWVNPYPTRFPCWQDIFQYSFSPKGRRCPEGADEGIDIISPKALPIEPLYYSEKINYFLYWQRYWKKFKKFCNESTIIGIGRPSKLALMALQHLNYQDSFYDAMDDFPEFYAGFSRRSMQKVEKAIAGQVKKIFVSSSYLSQKFPQAIKILNGYDMSSLFPLSGAGEGKGEGCVFGFVGTIGKWFDWDIVIKLACDFPAARIRLVGPQYVKYAGSLPPNIEIFPECTQPEALKYINQFDIGLIPFKQNALTQGVDPIKYYEYRAMGLSVLSTRFGEMNNRNEQDGVYFFDSPEDIKKIFFHQDSIEKIMQFREAYDWVTRFSACGFTA